ncbi:MAG: hypothetical protein VX589_18655, partial [Myxococcota bacterium]|nr:hypothetical protein [Myxococcota bacterium]
MSTPPKAPEKTVRPHVQVSVTQTARWLLLLNGVLLVGASVLGHGALAAVAGTGVVIYFTMRHWIGEIESDLTRIVLTIADDGPFSRRGPGQVLVPLQITVGPLSGTRWTKFSPVVEAQLPQETRWMVLKSNSVGSTSVPV